MPIRDIQMELREAGRIRCGDQVQTGKGRAPRKLDRFRFTSDDVQMLELIADRYGGTVEPWPDAPSGEQLQVYVTADRIPVMMVPGLRPITQWWEAWTGGGCTRRCDGTREVISGAACPCASQGDRICKPTTRLHVVLPEIPGLGTWRLETHGYYAAAELGGIVGLISKLVAATGEVVYGTLRLTQRTQKVTGQPVRHFAVPTLDVNVTVPDLVMRMEMATGEVGVIDGANAERIKALAAGHMQPAPAFPSDADREAAEARGQRKVERKRTPDMGPGRRGKILPSDTPVWVGTPDDDPSPEGVVHAFTSDITPAQLKALQTLFRMTGLDDRDERLLFSARIIGRSINSSKALTSVEASQIIDVLAAVEQGAAEYLTDADGRIIGAVPVDTDPADIFHTDPLSDAGLDDD